MADGSGLFQHLLQLQPEIIVDLFAGGGGASEGLENAFGIPVHVAVNHNPIALAVHRVNHPSTVHMHSDVYEVCPYEATRGRPVGHLHASPDCTHHSQAKGGQPRDAKSRALTWVVRKWAGSVRPRCITIENVSQILQWGPLVAKRCKATGRVVKLDGSVALKGERVPLSNQFLVPCPKRRGKTWQRFVALLRADGYEIEWKVLSACDYGAPTTRKRLYAIARRDGQPIVWPAASHGDPGSPGVQSGALKPWRTAAECIDFDRPCPSIFMASSDAKQLRVKRPLVDPTLRRVARGVMRFVLQSPEPFIVPLRGTSASHTSTHAVTAPLSTVSAGGTHHGLVVPTLVQTGYGERPNQKPRSLDIHAPLGVVVAGGVKHALVNVQLDAAHVIKFRGTSDGHPASEPMPVVTSGAGAARPAGAAHALGVVMTALRDRGHAYHLEQANTGLIGHAVSEPVSTVTTTGSQQRLVQTSLSSCADAGALAVYRFLMKYLSPRDLEAIKGNLAVDPADSTRGEVFIVTNGKRMVLTDVGLRMLVPRELARAQGFEDDYVLEYDAHGKPVTQSWQVALIGNSVCSDVLEAIVRANAATLIEIYRQSGVQGRPSRLYLNQLAA